MSDDGTALIRHIDPFTEPYLTLAKKRDRAHYLGVYRRIFDAFPKTFADLTVDALEGYTKKWLEGLFDPEILAAPSRATENVAHLWRLWLGTARGVINFWHDERMKMGLAEPSLDIRLGRDVASTPKELVYSSDLLDLYRYLPVGPQAEIPFVMFYSWINEYWILDLTPDVSHMRHLRDQGIDTYVTHWKVPKDRESCQTDLAGYLAEAEAALDRVAKLTGEDRLAIGGYCIGGVLADMVSALRADKVCCLVNLATALDTMAGEEGAGAFGAFTNFEIAGLDEFLARHGGRFPKKAFEEFFDNVKPARAVRSFFERYVYGQTAPMDPVTYWNRKSARPIMPVHTEFLRRIYNDNELADGTMDLGGRHIDLGRVTCPALVVMAQFDHIVPLPCALRTAHLLGTPHEDLDAVVVRGGHVRAIVNAELLPVVSSFLRPHLGALVDRPAFGSQADS